MVGLHSSDYFFIGAELLQNAAADFNVSTGNFVVNRFADIVEQSAGFGYCHIGAYFGRQHAGDMRHFYGVLQNILAVGSAEMQPAQDAYNSWIQIEDTTFISGLLALFFDDFINSFF